MVAALPGYCRTHFTRLGVAPKRRGGAEAGWSSHKLIKGVDPFNKKDLAVAHGDPARSARKFLCRHGPSRAFSLQIKSGQFAKVLPICSNKF
jgi:hypothetical protein